MEFRLVVRGALPPHKRGTTDARHQIRRELHPQLRNLWRQQPLLKSLIDRQSGIALTEARAANFERCGFRFVPLVTNSSGALCSVDVLILRRDEPHALFSAAGDLDGRVKTLLDALRMPTQCSELGGSAPAADENPFFVLMEDDRLIYEINVTTDALLLPPEQDEAHRDVFAVIRVKTRVVDGNVFSVFGV